MEERERCLDYAISTLADVNMTIGYSNDAFPSGYATRTLLIATILYETAERAEMVLNLGASPNLPDESGYYPLSAALKYGSTKKVELLLDFGADVGCLDADDMMVAVSYENIDIVVLLINHGADFNRVGTFDCEISDMYKDIVGNHYVDLKNPSRYYWDTGICATPLQFAGFLLKIDEINGTSANSNELKQIIDVLSNVEVGNQT